MEDLTSIGLTTDQIASLPSHATGRSTYLCRECLHVEVREPDGMCRECCLAALERAAEVAATLYRPEGPGRILEPLGLPEGLSW